jgi:hypothetical protein
MGRSRVAYAGKRHKKDREPNVSIVPAGTDISFGINSQHFVLATFIASLQDQSSSHTPKS